MFPRPVLIAALVATFLLGLILLFPARLAIGWFAPPTFGVSGVDGTVWRGRAEQVSVSGIYLSPVSWRFRPVGLFAARLSYHVEADVPGGSISADIGLSPTGSLRLSDVQASLPLSAIVGLLPVAEAEGRLAADLDYAVISGGWPRELVGIVSIEGLVYRPAGAGSIGNYRVEFVETDGEGLAGQLNDGGGPLEVTGRLTVSAERDYELSGQVSARQGAPQALANSLQYLGSPDAQGRREFSLAGRL